MRCPECAYLLLAPAADCPKCTASLKEDAPAGSSPAKPQTPIVATPASKPRENRVPARARAPEPDEVSYPSLGSAALNAALAVASEAVADDILAEHSQRAVALAPEPEKAPEAAAVASRPLPEGPPQVEALPEDFNPRGKHPSKDSAPATETSELTGPTSVPIGEALPAVLQRSGEGPTLEEDLAELSISLSTRPVTDAEKPAAPLATEVSTTPVDGTPLEAQQAAEEPGLPAEEEITGSEATGREVELEDLIDELGKDSIELAVDTSQTHAAEVTEWSLSEFGPGSGTRSVRFASDDPDATRISADREAVPPSPSELSVSLPGRTSRLAAFDAIEEGEEPTAEEIDRLARASQISFPGFKPAPGDEVDDEQTARTADYPTAEIIGEVTSTRIRSGRTLKGKAVGRRAIAFVLDRLLTLAFAAGFIASAHLLTGVPLFGSLHSPHPAVVVAGVLVIRLLIEACYHLGHLVATGATPGLRLMGLRVVSARGAERPTFAEAARRWLWLYGLSVGICWGAFGIARDQKGRALHDRKAGTAVVALR